MNIKNGIFILLFCLTVQVGLYSNLYSNNVQVDYYKLCNAINDNNTIQIKALMDEVSDKSKVLHKILTCLDLSKENEAATLITAELLIKNGAVLSSNKGNKLFNLLKEIIRLREYKLFQLLVPGSLDGLDEAEKETILLNLRRYAADDWAGSPATLRLNTLTGLMTKEEEDQHNSNLEKSYSYNQLSQKS